MSQDHKGTDTAKQGFTPLMEAVRGLAEAAGREIMRVYRSNAWTVTTKSDNSPVTQADLAANAVLVTGLQDLTHELIVSEEGDLGSIRLPEDQRYWLIDPLDGTRDFVKHLDTFVICIARIQGGYPDFGLIHAPVTGETWWAGDGAGTYGPAGERLMNTRARGALIAAGSRSMPSERMQVFYDTFKIHEVRRMGSALKFCRLAAGDVDLYPRFGQTGEWDTAAGQIIAEQAGCRVLEIASGERLRYGKAGFVNTGFMAARADLDLISPLRASGLIKAKT